jgi:hypothetical protein
MHPKPEEEGTVATEKRLDVSPTTVAPVVLTHRLWLLLRRVDEKTCLFFAPSVCIQEDEPALFSAAIAGFENRMAAAGRSIEEAESNAIDMFQVLIDYSIEHKKPLGFELGTAVPYRVLPLRWEKAAEFFEAFTTALLSGVSHQMQEWHSVPTTLLVAQRLALSSCEV